MDGTKSCSLDGRLVVLTTCMLLLRDGVVFVAGKTNTTAEPTRRFRQQREVGNSLFVLERIDVDVCSPRVTKHKNTPTNVDKGSVSRESDRKHLGGIRRLLLVQKRNPSDWMHRR